jgi:four helix bundle protein
MVQRFTELDAWRLPDDLRRQIEKIIARPPARNDVKFCDQIRGAVDSACANTAEGFGRFEPNEFRRFLVIARGSLAEVQNHLWTGLSRKYLSQDEFDQLMRLATRSIGANTGLQKYLQTQRGVRYSSSTRRREPRTR